MICSDRQPIICINRSLSLFYLHFDIGFTLLSRALSDSSCCHWYRRKKFHCVAILLLLMRNIKFLLSTITVIILFDINVYNNSADL